MINKKHFVLILIILSLFCLISAVSAEDSDLADNSNSSIANDSDLQHSPSLDKDTNQNVNNTSNKSDAASATNQNAIKNPARNLS